MQTIALLAHLVCERGIWGPHLIIVPTSVLLNWECELKKWCPALKILTYFGSLKERKQKRIVSISYLLQIHCQGRLVPCCCLPVQRATCTSCGHNVGPLVVVIVVVVVVIVGMVQA